MNYTWALHGYNNKQWCYSVQMLDMRCKQLCDVSVVVRWGAVADGNHSSWHIHYIFEGFLDHQAKYAWSDMLPPASGVQTWCNPHCNGPKSFPMCGQGRRWCPHTSSYFRLSMPWEAALVNFLHECPLGSHPVCYYLGWWSHPIKLWHELISRGQLIGLWHEHVSISCSIGLRHWLWWSDWCWLGW